MSHLGYPGRHPSLMILHLDLFLKLFFIPFMLSIRSDQFSLFISLCDTVKVCRIRPRGEEGDPSASSPLQNPSSSHLPDHLVEITHSFTLEDHWVCGLAPFNENDDGGLALVLLTSSVVFPWPVQRFLMHVNSLQIGSTYRCPFPLLNTAVLSGTLLDAQVGARPQAPSFFSPVARMPGQEMLPQPANARHHHC